MNIVFWPCADEGFIFFTSFGRQQGMKSCFGWPLLFNRFAPGIPTLHPALTLAGSLFDPTSTCQPDQAPRCFMNYVLLTSAALGLSLINFPVAAQTDYAITGQVTDARTAEGIPFASIAVKGRPSGTTSDAEGRFSLRIPAGADSLLVQSLGYRTQSYPIRPQTTQLIDARLMATATSLQEVKVYAKGGDPAYRIIRETVHRRGQFDPARLSAYQYESYTKIEAYVNNFGKKRKNGRRPGPVGRLLSKLPAIRDGDGIPAVPVFVSETYSEFYARSSPGKQKEHVLKSRAVGVGVTDGGLIAQLTGATFQQYNFYRNALNILRKDIPSPIGQQWETVYTFRLKDTVGLGDAICYEIEFMPKRAADLAFAGTVWIDTLHLALAQIDARVGKRANINFVDELHIEQEWEATASAVRFPTQTRVMIDTDEPAPRAPGALIRFVTSVRNIQENAPKGISFYDPAIELADDYRQTDANFWKRVRPDSLSSEEWRAMQVVDSVRNVPFIKVTSNIIKLGVEGHKPIPRLHIDVGPLLYSYANNTIEGNRFRLGLRTNPGFSRKWVLRGYVAYGTKDQTIKYSAGVEHILSRKPWTVIGFRRSYDLERVGVSADNIGNNSIFAAYSRFGTIRRPFFQEDNLLYVRREIGRGFTQTLALRNYTFEPLFPFVYRSVDCADQPGHRGYRATELISETRFAPDEVILQNDNERVSAGAIRKPIFTLRYTLGLRNTLGGDFAYHRVSLGMKHSVRLGVLGRTVYSISGGVIPATVPYPLLYTPLGNESVFYVSNAYNLMNYFEFVSDRWATAQIEHNFGGLLFNRLPLLRRLKWRELVTAKVLFGSVTAANVAMIQQTDGSSPAVGGFRTLNRTPYVEVGYGIDNIFKVLRVDAIHRLTYRNSLDPVNGSQAGGLVTPFAIKVSGWLAF